MKNVLPFILCFVTLNLNSQNFCLTKNTSSARINAAVETQPCKNYLIRVYIHRINGQT